MIGTQKTTNKPTFFLLTFLVISFASLGQFSGRLDYQMTYYDLDSNELKKDPQFITEFISGDSLKRVQHTKTGEQIYLAFLDSMMSYVLLDFYGEKYAVKIPIEEDTSKRFHMKSWGNPDVHPLDSNLFVAQSDIVFDSVDYNVAYTGSVDYRFNQVFAGIKGVYVLSYTVLIDKQYFEKKSLTNVESFEVPEEAFIIPEDYTILSLEEFSSMR